MPMMTKAGLVDLAEKIGRALKKYGTVAAAAKALEVSEATLRRHMRKLGFADRRVKLAANGSHSRKASE